jgi:cytochrome oxidase Cu insertion factor (SCO1/SenC/PrrC family)
MRLLLATLAAIAAVSFAAPAAARARACQAGGQAEPKSLAFVVSHVERRPAGEFVLTFENGEVWQQSDLKNKVTIVRGEQVVIRRAKNGTFTLVSRDGQSTRVKRVR